MSQPERQEVQIFNAALALPAAERAAYLNHACAGDAPLRRKVESLLQACGEADDFFQTVVAPPRPAGPTGTALVPLTEKPGDRIGRYKLLQQIGEGGCGVVFMADQEEPVRRRVALKVIKLGMDTRQVVARFEAERQALALMDHPNIAKVLDAGATETGRPYFVMELVRGVRLTEFCEENRLTMRQRLDLFVLVCHAVQHAHQKGIIHRDLKPSNILVTVNDGVPVPKVIDFGIAKATTGQQLTDKTLFTAFEQFMGTPAYMSPEQAVLTSLDIDTRSDIYSLGVLLYELLTGKTPFDARELWEAGVDEMRRTIREVEPPKPSTRLTLEFVAADVRRLKNPSTLDASADAEIRAYSRRLLQVKELIPALRGDLDWIVMKALEKDRARRYETANGFAADIQRHLHHEAVLARPPSLLYKFQKAVRRNKPAFAAAAAVLLALLAGLSLTAWQAVRANRALGELRASAPAFADQAQTLAAKDRFDEAIEKLTYATKLRPDAPEYFVQRGDLLQCQFRFADAAAAYRRALQLHPGDARVRASAALCDELLTAPRTPEGKLTRESLSKLHLAMQKQQRPAAELLPVARLLGEERNLLIDYWAARLKDLPISPEKPIEKRLVVQEDGLLSLELCGTRVVDLSPLADMPLGSLKLCDCEELTDLRPLLKLRSLTKLVLTSTKVMDLSPLRELKLQELDLSGTKVFDISPLRGMPLKWLSLVGSSVTDLSPLVGMPLAEINLSHTPIENFSPLSGLPLEHCQLRGCRLSDLSVLRGMPLKELVLWGCAQARNYSTLAELTSLESLFLPDEIRTLPSGERAAIARLRTNPKLQRIGMDVAGGSGYATLGVAESFWQEWDRDFKFLEALNRGDHISSIQKLPDGTYLLVCNKNLTDLSILADAPITILAINKNHNISDLSPIRNLKLTTLNISDMPVSDLSPLRGMPLEQLYMGANNVSDLSPLKGLPLRTLYVSGSQYVTNVAVLAEIPTMESLSVPVYAQGVELLRGLPKLERMGFDVIGTAPGLIPLPCCSAEVFWKTWDGLKWSRSLEEAGMKFSASQRTDGLLKVSVYSSRFTNCSIFKGASIHELDLSQTPAADFRPLLECTNLSRLILPAGAHDADTLRRLNSFTKLALKMTDGSVKDQSPNELLAAWKGLECAKALDAAGIKYKTEQSSDGFWRVTIQTREFSDCSVFRGAHINRLHLSETSVTNLAPLVGLPLKELFLYGTKVSDLSPLRGMPLQLLGIMNTRVADLSPLRGLPLTLLHLLGTPATNFSALADMPLTELQLNAHVTDISFLRGKPLRELQMGQCNKVTDYSPLAECPTLERLLLPPNATGIEFLRQFPKLKRISFKWDMTVHRPAQTAEEFWAEYDRNQKSH